MPTSTVITALGQKVDVDDGQKYMLLQARVYGTNAKMEDVAVYECQRWVRYQDAVDFLGRLQNQQHQDQSQNSEDDTAERSGPEKDDNDDNPFFGGSIALF